MLSRLTRVHALAILVVILCPKLLQILAQDRRPDQRAYREHASRTEGDVGRGKVVFEGADKNACAQCHTRDGSARLAGPDLSAIGDKFPRHELIRSLLEPSATIAIGFGTTEVETRQGEVVTGIVKDVDVTDESVELLGADAKSVRIARDDILRQETSTVALMPEGLEASMSLQEFADLVAYLESLRLPQNASAVRRGAPEVIPLCAKSAALVPYFDSHIRLERPTFMAQLPGNPGVFVVLEHGGRSWMIEKREGGDLQTPLIDMRSSVRVGGATGLLGLAFHPRFREHQKYYLKYQILEQGRIWTILAERRFSPDFKGDSGAPAIELLRIEAITQDHNGGCIAFGPDNYLYLGTGDTGPQGDPRGHGQNLGILLGKLLRIDVDHAEHARPYAIPADNPFLHTAGARPEIWALGFREPWRFSFDRETKELWVGDVGQDRFEEVAIVRPGENHGWNAIEGFSLFSDRYRREGEKYVAPVFSYSHRHGVSITGGFVYRGSRAPMARGAYVCADFESKRIWMLTQKDRELTSIVEVARAPSRPVSFAEDQDGELYVLEYDSGIVDRLDLSTIDPRPLETRVIAPTSELQAVEWRFSLNEPSPGWYSPSFDDSDWQAGPGGFGTHGTPGAIVRTEWRTRDIWLRRELVLPESSAESGPRTVALRLHHDEDAEVFINGREAVRAQRWTSGYVDSPIPKEIASTLRPGRNVIAIHCRQTSGGQYIDAGLVEHVLPEAAISQPVP